MRFVIGQAYGVSLTVLMRVDMRARPPGLSADRPGNENATSNCRGRFLTYYADGCRVILSFTPASDEWSCPY